MKIRSWLYSLSITLPSILGAFAVQPHHTTAFINTPGSIDNLFSLSTYCTDAFWNKNGQSIDAHNHFRSFSLMYYGEYAINPYNSIWLNEGYTAVKESLCGNSQGIEDLELGWKHLLACDSLSAWTLQLIAIAPIGKKKSSIRYSKGGIEADLLYSKIYSLYQRKCWYDIDLGYRYLQGYPSDQFKAAIAFGCNVHQHFQLIASSKLIYGVYNGDDNKNRNFIVNNANFRLLKLQMECNMPLTKCMTLNVAAFCNAWGRNVGKGGGFIGGLWINI